MREARRQRRLPAGDAPPTCVLDPDGDLVDYLLAAQPSEAGEVGVDRSGEGGVEVAAAAQLLV